MQGLQITQHTWDHTERSWVERVRADPGVLLLLGSRRGAQGYVGSLFSGEFTTQEQEFKALEENKQVAKRVSYQNPSTSLTKRASVRGGSLAL